MPIRPVSAAGLAGLALLAACTQTPGPTARSAPPTGTDGGETCIDQVLDRDTRSLALAGEIPVWRITNSGPATLILRASEDPGLAAPFPPITDGKSALFAGGEGYSYRLELEPSGSAARVRVCSPS